MNRRVSVFAALAAACALLLSACAGGRAAPPPDSAAPAPVAPAAPPTSSPTPSETPEPSESPEPSAQPSSDPDLLKRGDTGEKVKELQRRLKQIGWFDGEVTGEFDEATENAVKGFQEKRQLEQTGEADAETRRALEEMTRRAATGGRSDGGGGQNNGGGRSDGGGQNNGGGQNSGGERASGKPLLKQGDKGDKVRDLQARLKQIGWFNGPVTGNFGSQTKAAVQGFQGKRQLPQTGQVDRRTLDLLVGMTRKPTSAELSDTAPKSDDQDNKNKKQRDTQSGSGSRDADDESADDNESADDGSAQGLPRQCMTGRVMCISKASNRLWWVIDGKVTISFDVRFGTSETPTREGTFYVDRKSKDHVSNMYFTPMPYSMFFSRGQAVHYSDDFAANGYNGGSKGCVNVRDKAKIAKLYSQVRIGDKVYVYR